MLGWDILGIWDWFEMGLRRGECHNGGYAELFLELSRLKSGNHLQRVDDYGVSVLMSQNYNIQR